MGYQTDPTVYILDPEDTDTSGEFGRKLSQLLQDQYGLNVAMVTSDEGNVPLLLLCHNYSRIGTDIESAARKLKGIDRKKVAVLVINVKEPHALPSTNPTENLLDAKYEVYGRLIDFAFSKSTGIYDCKMNSDADRKLKDFLKNFMNVTPRNVGDNRGGRVQDQKRQPDNGGIWSWIKRKCVSCCCCCCCCEE